MRPTTSPKPARDRILDAASRLFYAEGVRAVGIDRIILEADIAKMTFYNHFASKEALVVAFLRRRDEEWRAWFRGRLGALRGNGVLAIFDAMEERFLRKDFRGCAFINAMVEAADAGAGVHRAARDHKEAVMGILREWIKAHGFAGDVPGTAYRLMLLMDGAIVAAVRDGRADSAREAKKIAAGLLKVKMRRKGGKS